MLLAVGREEEDGERGGQKPAEEDREGDKLATPPLEVFLIRIILLL